MSQLEIVKPIEVNGIEFYVSKDGSQCGVSQSGLARLAGVSQQYINNLLKEINGSEPTSKTATEIAKDLRGESLNLQVTSDRGAKVISSKAAARIITYYAFESRNTNEIAKYSLAKFAAMGIDSWIKEVTGYAQNNDIVSMFKTITNQLGVMQEEMSEMKVQLFETEGFRAARVVLPGLKEWMETVEAKEFQQKAIAPSGHDEELFTLNEWAEMAQDGLVLSKSQKHSLANIVSSVYKLMELEPPAKVKRKATQGNPMYVQGYPRRHFVLLNMCYAKLVNK